MENILTITDYVYSNPEKNIIYPLKFISHDRQFPLIAIPISYRGDQNPYFRNMHNKGTSCRVINKLELEHSGTSIKYRKTNSYGGPVSNIYTGFFSAIATRNDFDYMPSGLLGNDIHYRMKAELDIFCLGIVKLSRLPQVKWIVQKQYRRYVKRNPLVEITYDMRDVKILVSEEKLRKSNFMKDNYTATIRTNLLNKIKQFQISYPLTVEDVSDDYLEEFVIRPNTVRTNSLGEVITMSNEIKDSVFSNLNTVMV